MSTATKKKTSIKDAEKPTFKTVYACALIGESVSYMVVHHLFPLGFVQSEKVRTTMKLAIDNTFAVDSIITDALARDFTYIVIGRNNSIWNAQKMQVFLESDPMTIHVDRVSGMIIIPSAELKKIVTKS